MTQSKKIAIVILNWNGSSLLAKFLPSVMEHSQGENISVIIADNGSTDDSIVLVEKQFPEASVIRLSENYGFARGYNEALRLVEADYFVILNSDVEVTPGWISPCIDRMEANKTIAAVQPKIRSYSDRNMFEYAGATGGFIDRYGYPFCRGRLLNVIEADLGQYDNATPIFWATGACMFVRAEVFKESGGFDPDFWAHMEEIDLCWRIKNRGYSVWYEPNSVVYHLGGGTLTYNSPKKIYLNFRNNLLMLLKNLPTGKVFKFLFLRMILDGIAAIKFLAGFNFYAFVAVVKAHIYFYSNLSKFAKKRKQLLPLVTCNRHAEMYQHSLMLRFFIQNRKKFSEINFQHAKTKV
jgi:GT2 family glycosyltransferase